MLGDSLISSLEQALNRSSLTQRVIAQNIANVDTPNYQAQQVTFSQSLSDALQARRTDPRHLTFTQSDNVGNVVQDNSGAMQNNGNNVDIDTQMISMAKNQLNYQAYADAISRKFNAYNIVLGGQG